ncbi:MULTISPECIES: aminomethyltransferase family protein [Streptomyces]|uniref:aminomethyltransferase family protein n=1 Tax=Streptomyces TaxID=1883 RepID=UPI00103C2F7A|nr:MULTISPECIES: aminomethyltransferase family protein [Streptomyces]MBT3077191.1 aminomethyl transferase family protein [Streptomyces sp. COG21]MBT3082505.1 aminomethyl transferase family protein [Streptomyces sp. COG20]MBT3088304.1 aminomethyl transferase family protein [Streptomyces sp. CYG21]MBT3100745.1 aminomethyl transferase family protein [Streptomyces sp. CBG30]MBT3104481.1 aminomethyl transferase family protein [Streptomyces sp. COG19]
MTTTTLTTSTPTATTPTADYATLRTTVGAYRVTAPLVRLTGDDRLTFLDGFLAKSADYVEPDTVREALALNADGTPFAILLHFEIGDASWLLPRTAVTAAELAAYLGQFDASSGVTVEIAPEDWGATAFEGPVAWSVAAGFVDFDISGLTLHAVTEATPNIPGATAHLARVGTTGEYGYLLLSDAPEAAYEAVLAAVVERGGAEVGAEGLARVQAEAGMGVYGAGFGGLSVAGADLAWMIDWNRTGEFHGSEGLAAPTDADARLTALVAPVGSAFAAGAPVLAGDRQVGTVLHQAPAANPAEELLLAVLDAPFWVPGLELTAVDGSDAGRPLRTATLPRVVARSLTTKIA